MNAIKDAWVRLHFSLRNQYLSKVKVRPDAPKVLFDPNNNENKFYRLVLATLNSMVSVPPFQAFSQIQKVVDVGCRNWSYLPALSEAFPNANFLGVEVDGGRRLANLHRRKDVTHAFAAKLTEQGRQAQCWIGDFRKMPVMNLSSTTQPLQTLFTFFYPFVSADPCLGWGLPLEYARYDQLLKHTQALAPGATVLSLHQGQWETDLARKQYQALGWHFAEQSLESSLFYDLWPSPYKAGLFIATPRSL